MKRGAAVLFLAGGLLLPVGCGGVEGEVDRWEPTGAEREIAVEDCDDQVDTRMQLHGYPRRPSRETPQYRYRVAYFEKCMRDKGYEPD